MNNKSLVTAIAGIVLGSVVLVTLTTTHIAYSQEIKLDAGKSLQAMDIRKNKIPFTSIWLRRNIELVQKHSLHHEEIIFRKSLSPRHEPSHPRLEMKSKEQVLISIKEQEPILVKLNEKAHQAESSKH